MKEIKSIVSTYNTIDFSGTKAALATVVRVEGSSYRRSGARMLVLDNGTYLGGISGGCLEGDALRRAQKAIVQNKPSVITYDTTQDDGHQIGIGLGCNGIIDVLFTPLDPSDERNAVRLLAGLIEIREPAAYICISGCNEKLNALGKALVFENDVQFLTSFPLKEIAASVLPDIKDSLRCQKSQTITYNAGDDSFNIFIEVILPVIHLVIYGSNYDIYSLARICKELGWDVTAVTNITKADRSLFSTATKVLDTHSGEEPFTDQYSAILLMAHDYQADLKNLEKALKTNASYIGLLGPRKRALKMFDALKKEGKPVSTENLERIFAPAGLDIGATTPEEIALSIASEILSHFAGRKGMSLKLRTETIYGD